MYYKAYDARGQFKRTIPLGTKPRKDEFLKGASCIIFTHDNKILLEVRGKDREAGNLLDFCSGRLDRDETPREAIIRELQEELGIPPETSKNVIELIELPVIIEKRQIQKNWILTFFLLFLPEELELRLQTEEVQNTMTLTMKELSVAIKQGRLQFPIESIKLILSKIP